MIILIEMFFMGVGLAMDAFAVSICKGLGMKKVNKSQMVIIGIFFGGFQALMPLLGWILGKQFEQYITSIDHWIAFVLLGFIGGKMIVEALKEEETEVVEQDLPLNLKELFVLAIATSIDALAVGITFAFLGYPIVKAILIIGIVTMILSMLGVCVGCFFGSCYKKKAELAGGLILVCLGLKILLTHLGIL